MPNISGSVNLPTDDEKADLRGRYAAAKNFLDTAITEWATMTGAQKQTWVANNMDKVLEIDRAILVLIGRLLA